VHLRAVGEFEGFEAVAGFLEGDDNVDAVLEGGECHDADVEVLGEAGEAEDGFCDEGEGAFGADDEVREVVSCAAFSRPVMGLDDTSIGQHACEGDDVLLHRSVAVRVGAGAGHGNHAAYAGSGRWVYGKEESFALELLVELDPSDSRLDDYVHVVFVELGYGFHSLKAHAYSSSYTRQRAAKTRACAKTRHRYPFFIACLQ
jgi:hypothetical protein